MNMIFLSDAVTDLCSGNITGEHFLTQLEQTFGSMKEWMTDEDYNTYTNKCAALYYRWLQRGRDDNWLRSQVGLYNQNKGLF